MNNASDISIKELRQVCQATAPNPEKETLSGRFCRFFSIYLTKIWIRTSVTPNQLTFLGTLIYFLSAFSYFGSYRLALFAPLFYFLSIVVDACDGEVARFRKKTLKFKFGSKYAEPASHDIQYGFFFFIISIALFYHGAPPVLLIFGAGASISKLLFRLIQTRFWHAYYEPIGQTDKDSQNSVYGKRNFIMKVFYWSQKNIFSYPGTLFPLLAATLFNRMDIFVIFYCAGYSLVFFALLAKHLFIIAKNQ